MLRLDPGDGRIATTRQLRGLGGRRRVQRRARPAPLLRPAHRDRHRARRQPGRPAGRGPDLPGRRRPAHVALGAVRRRRPRGAQRAQLHRARLRRPRRALGCSDRGTPAASQLQPGRRRLGRDLRRRGRALVPLRRHLRARSREHRGRVALEAMKAARRHGTIVSYDLNYRQSLWKAIGGTAARGGGEPRARRASSTCCSATRRTSRRRSASSSRASTTTCSSSTATRTSALLARVLDAYPNLALVATTLREAHTATRQRLGRRLPARATGFHVGPAAARLEIFDRVGGGDSFASGLDLRPARRAATSRPRSSTASRTARSR